MAAVLPGCSTAKGLLNDGKQAWSIVTGADENDAKTATTIAPEAPAAEGTAPAAEGDAAPTKEKKLDMDDAKKLLEKVPGLDL